MSDLKLVKKEKGYERNNCIFKFLNSDLVNVKLKENVDVWEVEKDIGTYLVCSCCRAN